MGEQGPDFPLQGLISSTDLLQEGVPFVLRAIQHEVIQALDFPPPFAFHLLFP